MEIELRHLDWTAVAALATLVLALFTYRLARSTQALSKSTADEVASQARPMLVPGLAGIPIYQQRDPFGPEQVSILFDPGRLLVSVRNAGPGVALAIRAQLVKEEKWGPDPDLIRPGPTALPAGEQFVLDLPGIYVWRKHRRILLQYTDVAGRRFSSEIGLKLVGGEGGVYEFDYVNLAVATGAE